MPKVFGIEHILYVVIFLAFAVPSIFLIQKFAKTKKQKFWVFKFLGLLQLCLIVSNRISICLRNDSDFRYLIPDSFCGLVSLVLALTLLFGKKNNPILHFTNYIGFIGGMANIIYPTYISQNESFFYHATITGLLHHSMMVYIVVLSIIVGYFKPSLKKWYPLPIGLCFCMLLGLFEIHVIGLSDAFQIYNPLVTGSFLYWWGLGIMIVPASYLIMFFFDLYRKKHNRQTKTFVNGIKIDKISKKELIEIGNEIGDSFFDHDYEEEQGMRKYFNTREKMRDFMTASLLAGYRSKCLYATSDNKEGFVIVSTPDNPLIVWSLLSVAPRMFKAMGNFNEILSICKKLDDKRDYKSELDKKKVKYVFLVMLVVRNKYKGQGNMHKLMDLVYEIADKEHLPIVFDTDASNKKDRYVHLGMECVRTRSLDEGVTMYDLYRKGK